MAGNSFVFGNVAQFKRLATDPASAVPGSMYFNTTSNKFRLYDGISWENSTTGVVSLIGQALNEFNILVGNNSNVSAAVNTSTAGDISVDSVNGLVIKASAIVDSMISNSAAISRAKLANGTANRLAYNNGSGVLSDLAALTANRLLITDANGLPIHSDVTATEAGYLSGVTSSIQTQLDSKLNLSGGSMTGNIVMANNRILSLPAPVNANEPVRLVDLQNVQSNADYQGNVDDIQTDNTLVPVQTAGKRYIITNSASLNAGFGSISGLGNGDIVEYNGTAFVVAVDVSLRPAGSLILVGNRADNQQYEYKQSTGTWDVFYGFSANVAGIGLELNGNVLDVKLGAGIAELPTDEIGIDLRSGSGLQLTLDGTTDSTASGAQLQIKLADGTLFKDASGLKIATGGITDTQISSTAGIALTKLAALTADRAVITNGSGVLISATTTATEIGYLSGVTSAIQTQLDGKANLTLSNLAATTAINSTAFRPAATNMTSLGSPGFAWATASSYVYRGPAATLATNVTVTNGSNSVTLSSVTGITANSSRLYHPTAFPDGTAITAIAGNVVTTAANAADTVTTSAGFVTFGIYVRTENELTSAPSGEAGFRSGNTVAGRSGDVFIRSGNATGGGRTGDVNISSGTTSGQRGRGILTFEDVTLRTNGGLYIVDNSAGVGSISTGNYPLAGGVSSPTQIHANLNFNISEAKSMQIQYEILDTVTGHVRNGRLNLAAGPAGTVVGVNDTFASSNIAMDDIDFDATVDGSGNVVVTFNNTTNACVMRTFQTVLLVPTFY